MPGVVVDGQDVVAVQEATRKAVERARNGGGPTLIEAMTCRFRGHYEGDSQEYRDRAELERLRKERDPLILLADRIRQAMPEADTELERIRAQVAEEVAAAAAKARGGTPPTKSRVFEHVYA
jgi:pyruvate dehydrogenase E1 component alpha subunit